LPSLDRVRFDALIERAFERPSPEDLGETHSLVVVQGGRLVFERYAHGYDAASTFPSWSMAKSITQALAGFLVAEGRLDIHAPADVPEWTAPGDPRAAITLNHLFHMSSGLAFVEVYSADKPSDVIEMLFGKGKDDTAAFAAAFPAVHPPGAHFYYSSGTTNIISRCLSRATGLAGADFETFMRRRLLDPLGMASAEPKFDAAGTFIGSSYCFATTRDFAKFGLLYLRGGVWEGVQLLPGSWIDYARAPTYQQPDCLDGPYGAHWWLDMAGPGSFSANGYQGQHVVVCPDQDLIIARNGATPELRQGELKIWLADLAGLFR
jgi:CubicO group peptidase (beta-lactamase class C family)